MYDVTSVEIKAIRCVIQHSIGCYKANGGDCNCLADMAWNATVKLIDNIRFMNRKNKELAALVVRMSRGTCRVTDTRLIESVRLEYADVEADDE